MKYEDELLVRFARDVVANAFDQAVDAATRCAKVGERGFDKHRTLGNGVSSAEARDLAMAVAAAEGALASLFSNMELLGICRMILTDANGENRDLEDLLMAPACSKFLADGWLQEHSKYHRELAKWQV
jgi:hypothetical protein